jgi:hypothetical protein
VPGARPGRLQQLLDYERLRDPGTGSTLQVLERAGLLQLRYLTAEPGDEQPEPDTVLSSAVPEAAYYLQVQVTRAGRAACREGGVDLTRAGGRAKGLLAEGLWTMMTEVWQAGPSGLERRTLAGAWDHLTGRAPDPYVTADGGGGRGYRLRLTPAGQEHYAEKWDLYVRCYPAVAAPHPAGEPVWPGAVDTALEDLAADCMRLRNLREATAAERDRVTAFSPATVPEAPASSPTGRDLRRLLERRDKASTTYAAALQRAADRYTTVLDAQTGELTDLYRAACVRYTLAATAVIGAVTARTDPAAALAVDPAAVTAAVAAWPWFPGPPVTGCSPVDADLRSRHQSARTPDRPHRRRRYSTIPATPPPDEEQRLTRYAAALAGLVKDGQLTRLLLRA